jgi:hypothetical protein
MDSGGRSRFAHAMAADAQKAGGPGADARKIALDLLGDAGSQVRNQALRLVKNATISAEEATAMEPLLARKASDLRQGIIYLLLRQAAPDAQASADRLLASGDALMRQAGEEMVKVLHRNQDERPEWKVGLGLFDPAQRTPPKTPVEVQTPCIRDGAAAKILTSLDALIDGKREVPVVFTPAYGAAETELLGNLRYLRTNKDKEIPLAEEWRAWWENRPPELRDPDGRELPRAVVAATLNPHSRLPFVLSIPRPTAAATWQDKAIAELRTEIPLKYSHLVVGILRWLMHQFMPPGGVAVLIDLYQSALHGASRSYVKVETKNSWQSWRSGYPFGELTALFPESFTHAPAYWNQEDWLRYWPLARWFQDGLEPKDANKPPLAIVLEARRQGAATDADLFHQLIGGEANAPVSRWGFHDLARLTRRKRDSLFDEYPELGSFVDACRRKIVEVELARGDLATYATCPALAMKSICEPGLALRVVAALGDEPLTRGWGGDTGSRTAALSHILRISLPPESETAEAFREQARELKIREGRLIDLAVYAPQWAAHAEVASGLEGLESAAFWLHAHTKDSQWQVEEQIREIWFAQVSERTPLSREELLDGAVDVEWFREMHAALGRGVWARVLDSAKYASSSGGHKRAELFATALLGKVKPSQLATRIRQKRHQDSVRALGLIPLKPAEPDRRSQLLERYELLQAFIRGASKFGAQRAASEKLAAEIGLANLARTAGYIDPQRLSWAMETEALGDLRHGPVRVQEGGVTLTLSIDGHGEAQMTIEKKGKHLSDVPASLRKAPAVAALRTRKSQLTQQGSRMRLSLEDAMIRGEVFSRGELAELRLHPLMQPMLDALLFVTEGGDLFYGAESERVSAPARIAHPFDLLASGQWQQKQQECLSNSLRQPFKQAFRELYILTQAEREQKSYSARYEGQQVNPKQAMATIGKRGWVNVPEEGLRRTYHREGISAWLRFLEGWFTPAEVDGLTVEHVFFLSRSDRRLLDLDQINPRIFSEVMRDLDLMVSVAHRGGVDPEASASTVEMRAALLRETTALLRMANVRLAERHALIEGSFGNYSVHLGSGVVHRQPGGHICIIPVHSQHRGRIFLPFADDDPKTAEVISRVLLLANDKTIQDPAILEQIR